jgi:hypothetical protein
MTTAYTSLLGLALPVTGELSGTWGDTVNNSITSLVDTSVAGTTNVSTDGDVTLTTTTGASNQARQAILLFSGARTAIRTVTAPAQSKIYTVINATTGGFAVQLVGAGPTTGLTIPNGTSATVAWNGSDFIGVSAVSSSDAYIYGVRVGRGGGAVATNTVVGSGAMAATATGIRNVAVGNTALPAVTSGNNNVGVGFQAGNGITSGNENVAVGSFTLNSNTSGSDNTVLGFQAGFSNTTASNIVYVGYQAGYSNTTGANNTGVGILSLYANTTGSENVAIGRQALTSNTTASNNTAVGYQAGYANTTGTAFTAVGYQAGGSNTTGGSTTAIGFSALTANSTGNYNVAIGENTLRSNTTASGNTGVGTNALYGNTTGAGNTAVGSYDGTANAAMRFNTTGSSNTAVGTGALAANTTASNNTAVGYQAGYSNTTGASNTFLGVSAGTACTTGSANTLIGNNAGASLTTGSRNTFVGNSNQVTGNSGSLITTGSANSILGNYTGNQGGLDIRTASNYIVLSDGDGNPRGVFGSVGGNNAWVFTAGDQTNTKSAGDAVQIIGSTSGGTDYCLFFNSQTSATAIATRFYSRTTDAIVGSITYNGSTTAYNTASDYRLKNITGALTGYKERIMSLLPKQGTWIADGSEFRGFVAHEFANQYPKSVVGEKDAVNAEGKPIMQAMQASSSEVMADLVAMVNELITENDSLKARLDAANL